MARLLLDENIPSALGAKLTGAGHEVTAIAEQAPGSDDLAVLAMARREARILLTFDADFGELIFGRGAPPPPAVLLFRLHPIVVQDLLQLALAALDPQPQHVFAVVSRDAIRMRPFVAAPDPGHGSR